MLTNEEVINKYSKVQLKFSSYYKYSFSFKGMAPDGVEILASYGGNAGDIYRYRVESNTQETLENFPEKFMYVLIKKDNQDIFEYRDY